MTKRNVKMPNNSPTPQRTLGISLAILLSVVVYTVLPLIFVTFTLILQSRIRRTNITVGVNDPMVIGGSVGFVSISPIELVLWSLVAVIFLGIALRAWRGKPSTIRYAFMGSVIISPIIYAGLWLFRTYRDNQVIAESGAFASNNPFTAICSSAAILPILITVYVVWYMNRGPARAFYRGYYLDASERRPETQ
jgi:hypothetical protein